MCWGRCKIVTLFVNAYEVMAWGLGGADLTSEQEGIREKWERGDSREWTILEALAVFKERTMKEHWVSSVSTYIWHWGVKTVEEGSGDH